MIRTVGLSAHLLAGLIALAACTGSAAAEPVHGCYIRAYSAEHLARNPKQVIRRIVLHRLEGDDPVQIGIVASLRGDSRRWDAGGSCTRDGETLNCGLDGDAGRVRVTAGPQGAQIDVLEGISFEADKPGGDLDHRSFRDAAHRSFVLPRAAVKDCK